MYQLNGVIIVLIKRLTIKRKQIEYVVEYHPLKKTIDANSSWSIRVYKLYRK